MNGYYFCHTYTVGSWVGPKAFPPINLFPDSGSKHCIHSLKKRCERAKDWQNRYFIHTLQTVNFHWAAVSSVPYVCICSCVSVIIWYMKLSEKKDVQEQSTVPGVN